jgi:dTMP kinase
MFITLDGIDGSGKSSQIGMLCEYLEAQGNEVLRVRDPGGTAPGEAIRSLLLDSELNMHRRCEALLFLAARSQLVEEQIRPALDAGKIVVSDRFLLANVVYQSIGSDLQPDDLWRVGEWAGGGLRPDLTLLLDMPADGCDGARRSTKRSHGIAWRRVHGSRSHGVSRAIASCGSSDRDYSSGSPTRRSASRHRGSRTRDFLEPLAFLSHCALALENDCH